MKINVLNATELNGVLVAAIEIPYPKRGAIYEALQQLPSGLVIMDDPFETYDKQDTYRSVVVMGEACRVQPWIDSLREEHAGERGVKS